jgi:hypothetical protein
MSKKIHLSLLSFNFFVIQSIFADNSSTMLKLKRIAVINIYPIKGIAIFDKIATLMLDGKFMFLLGLSRAC